MTTEPDKDLMESAGKQAKIFVCGVNEPSTPYEIGAVRGLSGQLARFGQEVRDEDKHETFKMFRALALEHGEDVEDMTNQEIMEFDPYQAVREERALSDWLAKEIRFRPCICSSQDGYKCERCTVLESHRKAREGK